MSTMRASRWLLRSRQLLLLTIVLLAIYWMQKFWSGWTSNRQASGSNDEHLQRILAGDFLPADLAAPLPRPPPPNRWVILRTDNLQACEPLASAFSGWNVVLVVDDTAENPGHRSPRCQYQDVHSEIGMSQAFLTACLLAIKDGAEAIYALSEGADLKGLEPPADSLLESPYHILMMDSSNTFADLHGHFGCQPASRALPHKYSLCQMDRPVIQTSTYCSMQGTRTACDPAAPSVVVSAGSYALTTLDNTLFMREAFWALPLACSDSFNEKMMMSLLVQRALWHQGRHLAVRNVKPTLAAQCNALDEALLSEIMAGVEAARCQGLGDAQCVLELLEAVAAEFSLTDSADLVRMATQWVHMLEKLHANAPLLRGEPAHNNEFRCDTSVQYSSLTRIKKSQKPIATQNLDVNIDLHSKTCQDDTLPIVVRNMVSLAEPWTQIPDVLLIVVFNNPLYGVIPYLELIYRSFFPLILYCGPQMISTKSFPELKKYTISFVTYGIPPEGHVPGSFSYKCTSLAMGMGYNVAGYLTVADDMILFPHKLASFPRHAVWYLPRKEVRIGEVRKLRECRLGMCDFFPHWNWWEEYQTETLSVIKTLQRGQHTDYLINKCYRQLVHLNGGEFKLNGGYSDVYYMPSRLGANFERLVNVFLEHNVFLEIAVPTILQCLENLEDVSPLPGTSIWEISRDQTWLYWTVPNVVGKTYLHPTKWSYMYSENGTAQHKSVLCGHVLPFLHDRYARFMPWNSTEFYKRKIHHPAKRGNVIF